MDNDTVVTVKSWDGESWNADETLNLMSIKDMVKSEMAKLVDETKTRSGSEIFEVPTKNGCHIMTPPFNRSKMAFLGDNLKTDAMTLAYFQWED